MNIYTSFLECANRWIDRPAMEHQMEDGSVRKFDYRQTIAWVESYADELAKYGIKAGSRIAIIAEACPEWNVAYYAIAKFEATSVLIDPSLPQPELLRLIEFAEVDALIVNSGVYAKLTDLEKVTTAPVLDLMDGLKHLSGKVLEQPHATPGNPEVAFIIFSSGTTRVACGIMHGHDQIINTALSTIRSNGLNETDRYMAILPNSHIYGTLTQIFGPYLTGANVRFVQSLTAPALVQCFSEHHPTIIPGVPKLYELLENAARRKIASSAKTQKLFNFFFPICLNLRRKFNINLGKKLFGSVQNALGGEVRLMVSAGAPMRKDTADFYFATGFPLMITYGSTETNVPVTGNRAGHYTTDTCGRPYPDIQLSFSDSGEVLIKSPYQMLGYFKDEEATKAAFDENGWLLSGDLGYLDADGNLCINGRRKENIVLATGKKVAPDDIEDSYSGLPGVKELVIAGVPVGGEGYDTVHAFVVPEPGKEDAVIAALQQRSTEMAHHMQLSKIHVLDEIPRTALQKPKRYLLRKMAEQEELTGTVEKKSAPKAEVQETVSTENIPALVYETVAKMADVKAETLSDSTRLFIDLAIDSLGAIDLALELEEKCGVALGHLLKNETTLGELVKLASVDGAKADPEAHYFGDYPKTKKDGDFGWYRVVQNLIRSVYRVNVRGEHTLPKDQGYIICANHVSNFDYLYLTLNFEKERFLKFCCMGKKELLTDSALSKWMARIAGMIPVDRGGMVMDAMANVKDKLQEKWGVLIHPEGTRSKDGMMARFKKGAAILAIESGAPIVPAYIKGGYEIYPRTRKLPKLFDWKKMKKYSVEVIYGEPISPAGLSADELILKVEQAVRGLSLTSKNA